MSDEGAIILGIILLVSIAIHVAWLRWIFRVDEIVELLRDIKKNTSSDEEPEPEKKVDYMTWLKQKAEAEAAQIKQQGK
jgi:hypothetical protein